MEPHVLKDQARRNSFETIKPDAEIGHEVRIPPSCDPAGPVRLSKRADEP